MAEQLEENEKLLDEEAAANFDGSAMLRSVYLRASLAVVHPASSSRYCLEEMICRCSSGVFFEICREILNVFLDTFAVWIPASSRCSFSFVVIFGNRLNRDLMFRTSTFYRMFESEISGTSGPRRWTTRRWSITKKSATRRKRAPVRSARRSAILSRRRRTP